METSVSRRDFVKMGAAAAALPAILKAGQAPAVAAGPYYRANETVRVACVGYSDRFKSSLLPCFLHHNKELNFDMVAVADLWRKRLVEDAVPGIEKKIGHKIASYKSDVDLYENAKDVDAVIISTADFQHAQHAQHAVVAGKDAYCEKPLAEDMYSANLLKDAVDAKRAAGFAPGAVLQIGSQRRSGKKYMAAKEFINSGKFGDISYVDLRWNVNQPKRWRRPEALIASLKQEDIDWNLWLLDRDPAKYPFDPRKYLEFRLFWPFSSGTPGQWMCHQIDTVAWFMDIPYPKSAMSSGGLYQWVDGRMSYDTFTTVLEYGESGVKGKGFQCVFQSHQTNCGDREVLRPERLRGHGQGHGHERGRGDEEGLEGRGAARAEGGGRDERQHRRRPAHLRAHAQLDGVRARPQEPERPDRGRLLARDRPHHGERLRPHGHARHVLPDSHAIALIMANASARTGMRATFCPKSRQVMVGGKPFIGYASTACCGKAKCCG